MAKRTSRSADTQVADYRHDETRKHIPAAGLASHGRVEDIPIAEYSYDPHLPPVLRFDPTGAADELPILLQEAQQRSLTPDEAQQLADALRQHQPWLEWAGKQEKRGFTVDSVPLHIHERVSAQAIIAAARRQPIQPSLFADPELEYREAIKFYQHDVDWSNRLILGDSLAVMHSLAHRENLAGKVQMIYIDPPYGIKFASNFQPFINRRAVTDRESDLTREPEQVKAYRDTWTLGVHTYLTYLGDRLLLAKELLADTGSIFVQIGEENVHRVRSIMDDVFGVSQFISQISVFKTTTPRKLLDNNLFYVLWYAKSSENAKYTQLFKKKDLAEWTSQTKGGSWGVTINGIDRRLKSREKANPRTLPQEAQVYQLTDLASAGEAKEQVTFRFEGQDFVPRAKSHWKTTREGLERLVLAGRVEARGGRPWFKKYHSDFPVKRFTNVWRDTSGKATKRIYVVQTQEKVIERCLLMTTAPGDLILDPTCGSGTSAFLAERWGRRWISVDTSRVAIAIARERLLTSNFDYYELANQDDGVAKGFRYEIVPHITLGDIANNWALDAIYEKWAKILSAKLEALNTALLSTNQQTRLVLQRKFVQSERMKGVQNNGEEERRRWLLPQAKWEEWEVPFDSDPDWPELLKAALADYRQAWRAKMDEVNATIAASAPQEILVDQPRVVKNVLRVSGPFTVESVQPLEQSLDLDSPIGGAPAPLDTWSDAAMPVGQTDIDNDPQNAEAHLEKIIRLLRLDGIRFPDNKTIPFTRLEPLSNSSTIHAEGEWETGGATRRVAVSIGPQYGPITAMQVEEGLRFAYRRGYDDLVFAGFTVDGAAQAAVQEDQNDPDARLRCHIAYINPDVNIGSDLLKDTPTSQLFTVSGSPRVRLETNKEGEYIVHMEGVDIYDPVKNVLIPTKASKVAAWFLDTDYNGRTFNISQAFFPDSHAWDKIAKALKTVVDPARFAAFSGTKSLPFTPGEHQRAAVKVIDPRGNEVMRIVYLTGKVRYD